MTFFKDLLADLVDKRLWPVAAGLVAALIAVPLALSKPAPSHEEAQAAQARAAARAARATAEAQPAVSLVPVGQKAQRRLRGMGAKDPFEQRNVVKVDRAPDAKAPETPPTDAAQGGADTGSGGAAPDAGSPAAPVGPVAPPKAGPPAGRLFTTYKVNVRFGEAGAERVRRNVPRLTALPSSSDPVVVFMGVLSDGKTAAFLVTSDATAQGDGTCKPTRDNCTYVYMREGEEQYFDVAAGTAGLQQYVLKVLDLKKVTVRSKAVADRANARESRAGRSVVRSEVGRASALRYSRASGTLHASGVAR